MSIVLLVYLASIVEDIKSFGGILTYSLPIVFLCYMWVNSFSSIGMTTPNKMKYTKTMTTLFIVGVILSVFTPKEKTIYLMAGASIAQDIANSPKTVATLDKVYKIVEKKLDEQLEEGIDKAVKKAEKKLEEVK